MASINFTQPLYSDINKKYVFSDIHLDIAQEKIYSKGGSTKNKNDIKADYNIDAIKNSIRNLFNTKKGQRMLTPEFGINLDQYLFEPISRELAYSIGEEIRKGIVSFEPRVTPIKINVAVLNTEDGYEVTLILYINALSINTTIEGNINTAGFVIR